MSSHASITAKSGIILAALLLPVWFSGCATTARFSVEADSLEGGLPASSSYRLAAGPSLAAAQVPAAFRAGVLADVRTALSSRGLYEAPDGVAPELAIEVEFGEGRPELRALAHAEPVYLAAAAPGSKPTGIVREGGTTRAQAMPRKVGELPVTTWVTVHPKMLRIVARLTTPIDSLVANTPVWGVVVKNEDESTDLASHSRLMVAAAMDLIGRETELPHEVVVSSRDRRVVFLAQGLGSTRTLTVGAVRPSEETTSVDG